MLSVDHNGLNVYIHHTVMTSCGVVRILFDITALW